MQTGGEVLIFEAMHISHSAEDHREKAMEFSQANTCGKMQETHSKVAKKVDPP